MIEVTNLRKTFGDVVAVDDLSFTASDGRITGLLGPNGAGKTTAIRALCGLIRPDRGSARIDGIEAVLRAVAPRTDPIILSKIVVPEGFSGEARVIFDPEAGRPLESEGFYYVFRIPREGELRVRDQAPFYRLLRN